MKMKVTMGVWITAGLWFATIGQAADLAATLEIKGLREQQKAVSASAGASHVRPAQPLLETKADEPLTLRWTVRNTGRRSCDDTLVHFLVVSKGSADARATSRHLPQSSVLEGALTMDFAPTNSASGTLALRIHDPGSYVARIEAKPDAANSETTAATIALEVK